MNLTRINNGKLIYIIREEGNAIYTNGYRKFLGYQVDLSRVIVYS